MEEFLIGQHPVATYLVAVALAMFVVWCLKKWSERGHSKTVVKKKSKTAVKKKGRKL